MTYTLTKVNFLCERSTIFKAMTIFIMTSLHILIMATLYLQTIQYMYLLNLFAGTKTYIFVCMCTCCDKNGGKVAEYFEIMAN